MAKRGKFEAVAVRAQKKSHVFAICTAIYAVIFLALTAFGWKVLWDFLGSYEQSRPKNTLNAYMDSLQGDGLYSLAGDFFSGVDSELQSEEECRELFRSAVDGKLSYMKDAEHTTDTRQQYMLLADKQVIGSFVMESSEPDRFGNRVWNVTESAYDFSFLRGEPITVTVPEDCTVLLNGNQLDASYVKQSDIPYELFGDFYADFDLPTLKTYSVENYLGEASVSVRDGSGAEVTLGDIGVLEDRLDNCSEEIERKLNSFIGEFIARYVRFSGSSKDTASGTFYEFRRYLLPDSPLIQRFASAIDGLQYGQSVQDQVADIEYHHFIQVDDDHWFVDVTYFVDTMGKKGLVQTTNNLKVIVTMQNGFYYVEGMTSY